MNQAEPVKEIFYGPDERQGLNVMRCPNPKRGNDTILVFIHGGAWIEGVLACAEYVPVTVFRFDRNSSLVFLQFTPIEDRR